MSQTRYLIIHGDKSLFILSRKSIKSVQEWARSLFGETVRVQRVVKDEK